MSKKSIITIVLVLLLMVGVGALVIKCSNRDELGVGVIVSPMPTGTPLPTLVPTPIQPTPTIKPTAEPTQKPQKEFTYYWNPQYNFEENDYTDNNNILDIQNNKDTIGIVQDKYYVTESSNISMSKDIGNGELQLISNGGDNIIVSEEDPTSITIQELRTKYLESLGFNSYLAAGPLGIPVNSEFYEEDGLIDWYNYVENKDMPSRVDISGSYLYIVTDDVIRTSYGNAMWIITYDKLSDSYNGMAYIINDTGMRIIKVNMVNIEDYRKCNSYLYEITDEVIHLIK